MGMNRKKNTLISFQIILWIILFLLTKLFFPSLTSSISWGVTLCSAILLITFFYLNYFVLIPNFLIKKKFFIYFQWILVTNLIFPLLNLIALYTGWTTSLQITQISAHDIFLRQITLLIALNILLLSIGTCIRIIMDWFNNEELRKDLENQKLHAELSMLKSQINPHFFFNTLNSIYSLSIQKSEKNSGSHYKIV